MMVFNPHESYNKVDSFKKYNTPTPKQKADAKFKQGAVVTFKYYPDKNSSNSYWDIGTVVKVMEFPDTKPLYNIFACATSTYISKVWFVHEDDIQENQFNHTPERLPQKYPEYVFQISNLKTQYKEAEDKHKAEIKQYKKKQQQNKQELNNYIGAVIDFHNEKDDIMKKHSQDLETYMDEVLELAATIKALRIQEELFAKSIREKTRENAKLSSKLKNIQPTHKYKQKLKHKKKQLKKQLKKCMKLL